MSGTHVHQKLSIEPPEFNSAAFSVDFELERDVIDRCRGKRDTKGGAGYC